MKAKPITKAAILILGLLIFATTAFAQKKPLAIEFAQISETGEFTETLEKFIRRLENEPITTKGYIDSPANTELGRKIKRFISENSALENRIMFWGNLKHPEYYRYSFGFGIYLIPQDAEVPYRCILEPCFCPTLTIDLQKGTDNRNSLLSFVAKIEGGEKGSLITFNWKVSAGKIIEGQGTPTIKVDAQGAREIVATVEINGACDECPREASFTTKIQ